MLIGTFADLDYPPDLVARLNDTSTRSSAWERIEGEPHRGERPLLVHLGAGPARDGSVELVVGISRDRTQRQRAPRRCATVRSDSACRRGARQCAASSRAFARAARCLARVTWSGSSTTVLTTHRERVSSLREPPENEQGHGCLKQHRFTGPTVLIAPIRLPLTDGQRTWQRRR